MLAKIIPVIALVSGVGAGVGAGYLLIPGPELAHSTGSETHAAASHDAHASDAGGNEFVRLNNQFVVPVVSDDRIRALVVLSLSLETEPGMREAVYAREPKLRDAFLRVLFDHANMGGFQGAFTRAERLDPLRTALQEVARAELGSGVLDVLITDIARQDT